MLSLRMVVCVWMAKLAGFCLLGLGNLYIPHIVLALLQDIQKPRRFERIELVYSLRNALNTAATTRLHSHSCCLFPSGAAACAQHLESAAPLSVPRRVRPIC